MDKELKLCFCSLVLFNDFNCFLTSLQELIMLLKINLIFLHLIMNLLTKF